MAYQFPSDKWIKALREELNKNEAYQRAAKDWEGNFIFIVEPDQAYPDRAYFLLELYHGSSPAAALLEEGSLPETEYTIIAPYSAWKKVIEGKLDPIQGMMMGQLKLTGDLMKIMRYPKAAQEIVSTCALVPTVW
jgi:putative sterol carrier protein